MKIQTNVVHDQSPLVHHSSSKKRRKGKTALTNILLVVEMDVVNTNVLFSAGTLMKKEKQSVDQDALLCKKIKCIIWKSLGLYQHPTSHR